MTLNPSPGTNADPSPPDGSASPRDPLERIADALERLAGSLDRLEDAGLEAAAKVEPVLETIKNARPFRRLFG